MVRRRPDDGPDKVARDQDGRRLTVTDQAVVDTMVERIVAGFQPARILLFGSRARGTDNRRGNVVGSVLRAALRGGKVVYERP